MPEQWIFNLIATTLGHMGNANGTSIQIYRLAYTWKVKMKKEDSIKGEGVG